MDAPITSNSEPIGTTLEPFGYVLRFPPGTQLADLDPRVLSELAERHRVLVLRGIEAVERHELAAAARRFGPLLPWSFGAINELAVVPNTLNYLYSPRDVPLHWDGAFLGTPPRLLFFHCVEAPSPDAAGETTFVDTTRIWANASDEQRARWRFLRFRYHTDKKAHYGGTFEAALVQHHPTSGQVVLRFAEPVDDLNPVRIEGVGLHPHEAAAALLELQRFLGDPREILLHRWQDGDYVIADNFTLLHGRRAFREGPGSRRHIRRINVMLEERRAFAWLWDSLRIRRPEFLVAEIPIALVPALIVAPAGELVTWGSAQIAMILVLLFHYGDMVNCLVDRDLDLTYKTRTAEAVFGLGRSNVIVQIFVTAILAMLLTIDLGLRLDRPWIIPWVACGLVLGWQYSARPLRLKARGILQIPALAACIFVGPMLLVPAAWVDIPPFALVELIVAYAAMQQGLILVNTAEDLREDSAFGLRTSAVRLGPVGSMAVAALLVGAGGIAVMIWLLAWAPLVVLLPLLLGLGWALSAIVHLFTKAWSATDPEAVVRHGAKWVPAWIAATAWGTLLAVAWIRG